MISTNYNKKHFEKKVLERRFLSLTPQETTDQKYIQKLKI